jgi:coproporphyrinogen III oxidase
MKSGNGYWRIMADLNPSLPSALDTQAFDSAIRELMPEDLYRYGTEQGNRYFFIPALQRCRGVAHFYLEEFRSPDAAADLQLARKFGQKIIETYTDTVRRVLNRPLEITATDWVRQLEYHSLYFLQVLTLDRGTTSGLLVHDENDAGILASLPSHVDRKLLQSWLDKLPAIQQGLLNGILEVLPVGDKSLIDDQVKIKIAQFSRDFYRKNPDAEAFLARGDRVPPTQQNHS